jgi:DNA-binding transcriptional LysR family regulator
LPLNSCLIHSQSIAVQQGAGLGIIPTHCVQSELQKGTLLEWQGKKSERAYNPIYLAKRLGERLPKRVETTIDLLMNAKLKETS